MSWAKLDDDFYDHPKVLAAGLEAAGLFAKGLSYSSRKLTNGALTFDVAEMLARTPEWRVIAQRLVDVGLFESTATGYVIHDYLRFNPSAQQVKKKRREASQRMKRARNVRANTSRTSREVPEKFANPVPTRTRPVPVEEEPLLPSVVVAPAVPSVVRAGKGSDTRTHQVRTYFARRYRETQGSDYVANWAKDSDHLKRVPASFTAERLCQLVDVFFTQADEYTRTKIGLNVTEFVRKLNALQAAERSSGSPEIDAIVREAAEAERLWAEGGIG